MSEGASVEADISSDSTSPHDESSSTEVKRLYVGNINHGATDRQLHTFLSKFGKVGSCKIQRHRNRGRLKNGHLYSRGYAFAQYKSAECAKAALSAQGKDLLFQRRELKICPATPKQFGAGVTLCDYYQDGKKRHVIEYKPIDHPEQFQTPLCEELMVEIFELLPDINLIVCASVCRQWYRTTVLTWAKRKRLLLDNHASLLAYNPYASIRTPWTLLRSSDLYRFLYLTAGNLEEIVIDTPCCTVDDEGLVIIGKACPRLKRLRLQRMSNSSFGWYFLSKHCPLLEDVTLDDCIAEKGMRSLLHNCPLKSLHVKHFQNQGASFRCLPQPSKLERVTFFMCRSLQMSSMLTLLQRSPNLVSLEVPFWLRCDVSFFEALGEYTPGLQRLCLEATDRSSLFLDLEFPESAHLMYRAMPSLPHLTYLNLSSNNHLDSQTLAEAVRHLPGLRELHLCLCRAINDSGIEAVAAHCPLLECLDISFNTTITQQSVCQLALRCPQLQKLYLRNCDSLEDAALLAIASHCKELHVLDISAAWCFSATIPETLDECRCNLGLPVDRRLRLCMGDTLASRQTHLMEKALRTIDCSMVNTAARHADHFYVHGLLQPEWIVGGDDDDEDAGPDVALLNLMMGVHMANQDDSDDNFDENWPIFNNWFDELDGGLDWVNVDNDPDLDIDDGDNGFVDEVIAEQAEDWLLDIDGHADWADVGLGAQHVGEWLVPDNGMLPGFGGFGVPAWPDEVVDPDVAADNWVADGESTDDEHNAVQVVNAGTERAAGNRKATSDRDSSEHVCVGQQRLFTWGHWVCAVGLDCIGPVIQSVPALLMEYLDMPRFPNTSLYF